MKFFQWNLIKIQLWCLISMTAFIQTSSAWEKATQNDFFMRTFCLWFSSSPKTSSFIKINKSESEVVIIPSLRSTHMFFIIFNVFPCWNFSIDFLLLYFKVFKFIYHHHFRMFAIFFYVINFTRKIFEQITRKFCM